MWELIVDLGLLFDANQIPIDMNIFSTNEELSIKDITKGLNKQNEINGKTIHIIDYDSNCSQAIASHKKTEDDYLYAKSI